MRSRSEMRRFIREWWKSIVFMAALAILSLLLIVVAENYEVFQPMILIPVSRELLLTLGVTLIGVITTYVFINLGLERIDRERVTEYEKLNYRRFLRSMSEAQKVGILDTYTELVLNETWREQFFKFVIYMKEPDAEIRVLLLNPDTNAALQRNADLNEGRAKENKIDVVTEIRKTLWILHEFLKDLPVAKRRFQVKIYNAAPSIALYQWDSHCIVSFFPIGDLSQNSLQAELSLEKGSGRFIFRKFEDLWKDNRTLTLSAYLYKNIRIKGQTDSLDKHRYHFDINGERYVSGVILSELVSGMVITDVLISLDDGKLYFGIEVVDKSTEHGAKIHKIFNGKYGSHDGVIYRIKE